MEVAHSAESGCDRRPLGAGARRNRRDEAHNFEILGRPKGEQVPGSRVATTARTRTGSPRRFVTESWPHQGGPEGENCLPEANHREGCERIQPLSPTLRLGPGKRKEDGARSLRRWSRPLDRCRLVTGPEAALVTPLLPPRQRIRPRPQLLIGGCTPPRDPRHLTFLKCVYYSDSDWGISSRYSRF